MSVVNGLVDYVLSVVCFC